MVNEVLEPDTFLRFPSRQFENDPGTDTVNFITNMAPTVNVKQTLFSLTFRYLFVSFIDFISFLFFFV